MATKIGTLQNPEKTEALLPRTCLKAVADKNGDYISEDVLASDINALKDGAIESLTPTLLWTNPNPLDAFSAQEITFTNTKNYLLFIIVLSGYTASASLDNAVSFLNVGSAGNISKTESGSNVSSMRNITASSQTSITFGNGMLNKADGSSTSDNSRAIPHKVYGLFAV